MAITTRVDLESWVLLLHCYLLIFYYYFYFSFGGIIRYTFVYYLKSFIRLSANKSFHDNSINHFIFIFHVNFDKIILDTNKIFELKAQ